MLIKPDTVLKDTAIAMVPMVIAGAVAGGWFGLLGTAVTGLVILGNLFLLGRLIGRVTAYLSGEDPSGAMAVALLVIKFPLLLGVITLLAWLFDGLSVALAMGAMIFAVFVRGVVTMFQSGASAEPSSDVATRS